MGFVSDQLAGGGKFRALTIVDVYTKEALAIQVCQRLRADDVVAVLNRLSAPRGSPRYLFVHNGSEFSGRLLDLWAYHHNPASTSAGPANPGTIATLKPSTVHSETSA
jgi:putative transposase